MAASKNPTVRLRHILDEAEAIRAATADIDFETFRDTWMIRRAVEHGLLIIAEACKSLPTELKTRHPAIPWARVEALGNVLRHEYQDIDPKVLWRIVHEQLPVLADSVRQEIGENGR
jgi:uncharacterized protein with HEPN domain